MLRFLFGSHLGILVVPIAFLGTIITLLTEFDILSHSGFEIASKGITISYISSVVISLFFRKN